ncbi:hypothetical protein LXL04_023480 [Taraxacum kok-saghyz]
MSGQSDTRAEYDTIRIVTNLRMERLSMISGNFGPFRPQSAMQVPICIAIALNRREKCTIRPPDWISFGKFSLYESRYSITEEGCVVSSYQFVQHRRGYVFDNLLSECQGASDAIDKLRFSCVIDPHYLVILIPLINIDPLFLGLGYRCYLNAWEIKKEVMIEFIDVAKNGEIIFIEILKVGERIDVQMIPNSVVINTGGQIEVLSKGSYKIVWHPVNAKPDRVRRSIVLVLFYNTIIEPAMELVKKENKEVNQFGYLKFWFGDYISLYTEGLNTKYFNIGWRWRFKIRLTL